jgi:DNA-binding CsgD family transcriptional regulator
MISTKTKPARPATAQRRNTNSPTVSLTLLEQVLGLTVAEAQQLHARLTPRQVDVAERMAQGMTNQAIAEEIGISPKTLDIHRADVFDKLKTKTTAGVARVVYLVELAKGARE